MKLNSFTLVLFMFSQKIFQEKLTEHLILLWSISVILIYSKKCAWQKWQVRILLKMAVTFFVLQVSLLELNFLPTSGSALTKQQLILARKYKCKSGWGENTHFNYKLVFDKVMKKVSQIKPYCICVCFRWCPWNWSLVEYPQKGHSIIWEIYGSAKMLLLWLQVISPFSYFICCGIFCLVLSSNITFLFFDLKGWTAWSSLHAPVTWTEPALPALTEPCVWISHRTWETECTRYSNQRVHQTSSVLRAGTTFNAR